VQRVLSANNIENARRGTILGGYLKLLPVFIFVLPGLIAHALVQSGQLILEHPDQALPVLINVLIPVGLKGLIIAGLLAALMSSLSSVFNSCSTLITWDIYKKINPEAGDKKLVLVGQISTAILVGFGLLWIPFMKLISGQLYQYLQSVQAYISPPIAAVFLIGILWKRVNSKGAIISLITGFIIGMGRLIAELNKSLLDGWLYTLADLNFLHFAILLFLICSAVLIGVSLMTQIPSVKKLQGLTFSTTESVSKTEAKPVWLKHDIILSILLLGLVGLIWIYFSG